MSGNCPAVDVNTVLLSVQERDKWRHRLQLLERSLLDVRAQRQHLAQRLRRIKRDLARLKEYSEAILDPTRHSAAGGPIPAAHDGRIPSR